MNWEAVGAIGEILGAAAVVATLAYLSIQIRQNTKVARSATRQAIAQSAQSLTSDVILTPDMAAILLRHLQGEALTPTEAFKLQGRCYRDMRHWENIYYQVREGLLSEEEWPGFRRNLAALFDIPAYRDYWSSESILYSEAFRKEVDDACGEFEKEGASVINRFAKAAEGERDA